MWKESNIKKEVMEMKKSRRKNRKSFLIAKSLETLATYGIRGGLSNVV